MARALQENDYLEDLLLDGKPNPITDGGAHALPTSSRHTIIHREEANYATPTIVTYNEKSVFV